MVSPRITTSNEQISTYGTSGAGRDYTVLNTWEDATDTDLVTDTAGEVLECHDDAASFDDTIDANGATTDVTFFRIIRAAAGQGHDGTPNTGFNLSITASTPIIAIRSLENFFSIQDIIIKKVINTTVSTNNVCDQDGNDGTLIGVIQVDSINNGTGTMYGLRLRDPDTVGVDCLSINCENHNLMTNPGAGTTAQWYNTTSVDAGGRGFDFGSGTAILKNCLADNNGTDFDSGFDSASTNNASSDATAPGGSNRINKEFTFVNAAGDDFHLAAADVGADNFGADLSADSTFDFDEDVDGDVFDTWDIGFDENDPSGVAVVDSFGLTLVGVGR